MEEKKHALLAPSSAARWLRCTGAPALESSVPDRGSEFAAEGTLAHAYCAKRLKERLGQPTDSEDKEIAELADRHTGEMDYYTQMYADLVWEKFEEARKATADAVLVVERRLELSEFIIEGKGTADAIIIADGTLEVIDFKYGKGVEVSAEHNPQLMIYAAGAYEAYSLDYAIDTLRLTIVQPRIGNHSSWQTGSAELLAWAHGELKERAAQAYYGQGSQEPGPWCQFCKVRARCAALAAKCKAAAKCDEDAKLLGPDEIAGLLPLLPQIKAWCGAVEEYALGQALAGVKLNGFKLVEGRSIRKITDPDTAAARLSGEGFAAEAIYKPQELRGISDLERLVGRKKLAELCGDLIHKPAGKPTLAPETDKRKEWSSAEADFANM